MTIELRSYIKKDEEYVDVFEFDDVIQDKNYIEGAICLKINDIYLINLEMWDYIDQLWAYFTEGVLEVIDNNEFETNFPDQPIKVKFKLLRDNVLVSVICHSEVKAVVNKKEFIKVFSRQALCFFEKLSTFKGIDKDSYNYEIEKLNSIHLN